MRLTMGFRRDATFISLRCADEVYNTFEEFISRDVEDVRDDNCGVHTAHVTLSAFTQKETTFHHRVFASKEELVYSFAVHTPQSFLGVYTGGLALVVEEVAGAT